MTLLHLHIITILSIIAPSPAGLASAVTGAFPATILTCRPRHIASPLTISSGTTACATSHFDPPYSPTLQSPIHPIDLPSVERKNGPPHDPSPVSKLAEEEGDAAIQRCVNDAMTKYWIFLSPPQGLCACGGPSAGVTCGAVPVLRQFVQDLNACQAHVIVTEQDACEWIKEWKLP
jgi:hypothetical protein